MFAGHPSLRFGEVIHFIELWGNNANNTIVFTEPSFPYLDALAPFQPLQMRAVYCPIDTSLNFNQAKKLVKDLKPGMIAAPKMYTAPPASATQRIDLQLEVVSFYLSQKEKETIFKNDFILVLKFPRFFLTV